MRKPEAPESWNLAKKSLPIPDPPKNAKKTGISDSQIAADLRALKAMEQDKEAEKAGKQELGETKKKIEVQTMEPATKKTPAPKKAAPKPPSQAEIAKEEAKVRHETEAENPST